LPDADLPISFSFKNMANIFNRAVTFAEAQLAFPKLSTQQKNFGVNPSYQAFNDPIMVKPGTTSRKKLDWQLGNLFECNLRWALTQAYF